MNIKNILNEWKLDGSALIENREITLSIDLKYPDVKNFIKYEYKERIKKIDLTYRENLAKLLALNIFDEYEVTGTKKRPIGIKTKIRGGQLDILNKLDFVDGISITSIENATRIAANEIAQPMYFCVKMTVVIEIEGLVSKRQDIEQRFVVIKALSFNDAYEKLQNQKDNYAEPYLNPYGRFVRWRIESFDDCYETDILSPDDLDKAEGVEIYSKIKSRKTKSKIGWEGKS